MFHIKTTSCQRNILSILKIKWKNSSFQSEVVLKVAFYGPCGCAGHRTHNFHDTVKFYGRADPNIIFRFSIA